MDLIFFAVENTRTNIVIVEIKNKIIYEKQIHFIIVDIVYFFFEL